MYHSLVFYLPAHHNCDIHHTKSTLYTGDYALTSTLGFKQICSPVLHENILPEAEESCVLSW